MPLRRTQDADGLILGSHGLFTWGNTQRECYVNSIETIDQMGQFIAAHREEKGHDLRRRRSEAASPDRQAIAAADPARSARRRLHPTDARSRIMPITRTR